MVPLILPRALASLITMISFLQLIRPWSKIQAADPSNSDSEVFNCYAAAFVMYTFALKDPHEDCAIMCRTKFTSFKRIVMSASNSRLSMSFLPRWMDVCSASDFLCCGNDPSMESARELSAGDLPSQTRSRAAIAPDACSSHACARPARTCLCKKTLALYHLLRGVVYNSANKTWESCSPSDVCRRLAERLPGWLCEKHEPLSDIAVSCDPKDYHPFDSTRGYQSLHCSCIAGFQIDSCLAKNFHSAEDDLTLWQQWQLEQLQFVSLETPPDLRQAVAMARHEAAEGSVNGVRFQDLIDASEAACQVDETAVETGQMMDMADVYESNQYYILESNNDFAQTATQQATTNSLVPIGEKGAQPFQNPTTGTPTKAPRIKLVTDILSSLDKLQVERQRSQKVLPNVRSSPSQPLLPNLGRAAAQKSLRGEGSSSMKRKATAECPDRRKVPSGATETCDSKDKDHDDQCSSDMLSWVMK